MSKCLAFLRENRIFAAKDIIMSREDRNKLGYTVALISEFAVHYGMQPRQAYIYLKQYDGLKHLDENYGILHTLSFQDGIESMTQVCANHGGNLR